jgi:hypothetical protein
MATKVITKAASKGIEVFSHQGGSIKIASGKGPVSPAPMTLQITPGSGKKKGGGKYIPPLEIIVFHPRPNTQDRPDWIKIQVGF